MYVSKLKQALSETEQEPIRASQIDQSTPLISFRSQKGNMLQPPQVFEPFMQENEYLLLKTSLTPDQCCF